MPYMTQLAAQVQYVYKWWHVQENRKCEVVEPGTVPFEVLQIRFYIEYCMKSPQNTTEETAQAFIDDMEAYDSVPDVFIYGDASGRNRITGLGSLTQYRILEGKLARYLPEGWMRVRKANIGVMKRRDLLNRIWEGKIPGV